MSMPVNQNPATKQPTVNRQVQRSLTGSAFSPHKEKKDDSVAEKYAPTSHNKNNAETGSLSGRSVDSRYMNDSASIVSESAVEIGEILFDKKVSFKNCPLKIWPLVTVDRFIEKRRKT